MTLTTAYRHVDETIQVGDIIFWDEVHSNKEHLYLVIGVCPREDHISILWIQRKIYYSIARSYTVKNKNIFYFYKRPLADT